MAVNYHSNVNFNVSCKNTNKKLFVEQKNEYFSVRKQWTSECIWL
jgi:hypothetical protein